MKRILNILAGLAVAVAIVALLAPASFAQCPTAREFGGLAGGKTSAKINVDTTGVEDLGNESAQFWETGNSANGTGVGASGSCDSQGPAPVGWWQTVGSVGGLRGIRGFISQPGCAIAFCPGPGASLSFLIEDATADGLGSGFVAYTVDETPAGTRWYDIARTDPSVPEGSIGLHTMFPMPTVLIQGSSGAPPDVTTATNDYPEDAGIAFHGINGGTPLPGSSLIDSYDVMSASGADPGRARSGWTFVKSIAYSDAAIIADDVPIPCTGTVPTLLAIGLTFDGGITSASVGAASLPFSCDPGIADPDLDTPKVRRPSFTSRPGRSGR